MSICTLVGTHCIVGACGRCRSTALNRVAGENACLSGVIVIFAVIAETMISNWR